MTEKLPSSYPHFQDSIEQRVNRVQEKFQNLPWQDSKFYAHWLAQTFFIVSHTPRFICLAAARFGVERDDFHRKMVSHFSDEEGHEYLLIDDLKNLGYSLEPFKEMPEASLMVQYLYYQIDRVDPVAIFGRILFLELMASSLDESFCEKFRALYTPSQSQFMRVHLDEDVEHVKKAFAILQHIPPAQQSVVGDNFYMTAHLYEQFMEGLLRNIEFSEQNWAA